MGIHVDSEYLDPTNCSRFLSDVGLISAINVLEHVADPTNFLKMITDELDEVVIVFEVPRHPSIASLNAVLFPELAFRHIYPPDHLHIFTEQSISKMLEDSNLEVVGSWNFGQDAFDFFQTVGASTGIVENPFWNSVLDICPEIQEVIDRNKLSDTSLIVAKKKIG